MARKGISSEVLEKEKGRITSAPTRSKALHYRRQCRRLRPVRSALSIPSVEATRCPQQLRADFVRNGMGGGGVDDRRLSCGNDHTLRQRVEDRQLPGY